MEEEEMNGKKQKNKKLKTHKMNFKLLIIIWASVFAVLATVFIVTHFTSGLIGQEGFWLINLIIAFASFVMTSVFSVAIFNHNKISREMSEENRRNSDEVNTRAEEFRTLQFVSSNYTVIDFTDYMLLYAEPKRYIDGLKKHKDFTLYMKEDGTDITDAAENAGNYKFITIKIPFKVAEGKSVGKIRFSRFKFVKEGGSHIFVPCGKNNGSLIIYNDADRRNEVVVNLITDNTSEFFADGEIIPFLKIKANLTMQSLLGVAVTGWVELYFNNPLKLENSGANKYKINSSEFEISGLPVLTRGKEE